MTAAADNDDGDNDNDVFLVVYVYQICRFVVLVHVPLLML